MLNAINASATGASADTYRRLQLLVDEAQRYHDSQPTSARRSKRAPSQLSSCASSVDSRVSSPRHPSLTTGDADWNGLRAHIEEFWHRSPLPLEKKYRQVKEWLVPMRLWDLEMTWDRCRGATKEAHGREQHARHAERLRALPEGTLFL